VALGVIKDVPWVQTHQFLSELDCQGCNDYNNDLVS